MIPCGMYETHDNNRIHENIFGLKSAHKNNKVQIGPNYLDPKYFWCCVCVCVYVLQGIFSYVQKKIFAHFCLFWNGNLFREIRNKDNEQKNDSIKKRQQTKSYYILCFYKIFLKTLTKDTNTMDFSISNSRSSTKNWNDNNKFQLNFDIIQFEAEDAMWQPRWRWFRWQRLTHIRMHAKSIHSWTAKKTRSTSNGTVAVFAHNTPSQNKLIFAGIFNLQYKYLCFMVSSLLRHHRGHRRRRSSDSIQFTVACVQICSTFSPRFFLLDHLIGFRVYYVVDCIHRVEMFEREEQAAFESCWLLSIVAQR